MKLFLIIMSFFILMGCVYSNQCVQILEIQYNENGILQEAYFYIGNLRKSPLSIYKGTIHDLKGVGYPPQKFLCFEPVNLKWGFYKVWMPDGRYMTGEGYGSTVYIRSICGYSTF